MLNRAADLPCRLLHCRRVAGLALLLIASCCSAAEGNGGQHLQPAQGDTIVVIGNTLAERLQYFGHWETLLHSRFPEHQLVVRNLGWSADELELRPRSKDFDQHGHRLQDHQPDIVFAMFGLNESFAGPQGLDAFAAQLRRFLEETTTTAYNGTAPPQVVLFSPIPHEDLHRRELPDGQANNANIQQYMQVMRREAQQAGVRFVDIYTPMVSPMDTADDLTINGIHLNQLGDRVLGEIIDTALFGPRPESIAADLPALAAAVQEKNLQFWYDYRAVNGYYIYGGRKNPYGVVNFPAEFAKLRRMIAVRDQRVWDVAAGRPVPDAIDDSGTGDLVHVESNVADPLQVTTPEQSLAMMQVPDGFVVELVASEVQFPDLQNPVAIEIDARGRIWVTTMPTYPQYLPGTPPQDKILILEDTDGDGASDKQTVFADGLHLPIGMALGDGGAYVSQQPNLMFLKDTDGDDVADQRQMVLHGFDSADSHHSISAFTWGPGGGLYFQEGTFHHTQVETPYGPQRVKDAAVFRYEPRTEKFDIFVSYPFANPWGHCFDRWGQNFVADASPGANYYGTAFSGQVIYPQKHRRLEQFLEKQWRPTCGCVIVSSRQFPESMQGNYLLNNTIGFLGTLQYRMREDGSGFAADPVQPLLQSSDNNFRPVDLQFGLDGALYIVDWFNPLIGHMQHSLRDPKRDKHHGRIWRVRYTKNPLLQPPQIVGAATADVVRLLERYEDAVREAARTELRSRPTEEVVAALSQWLGQHDARDQQQEHHRLEALWVLQHHDVVDTDLLRSLLDSPEPRARAAATRVLCYWRDRVPAAVDLLVQCAGDDHPRVRLEAVRAASFLTAEAGRRVVAEALTHPLDYYLQYTIGETNTTLDHKGGPTGEGGSALVRQLIAGGIPQAQLKSTSELVARSATADELGAMVTSILGSSYEPVAKAEAIEAIVQAADARDLVPAVDAAVVAAEYGQTISRGYDPLAAVLSQISVRWEVPGMANRLQNAVFDSRATGPIVQAALDAVLSKDSAAARKTLEQIRTSDPTPEMQLRAAAALAQSSVAEAAQLAAGGLAAGINDEELVRMAVAAVLARSGGADALAAAVAQLPPQQEAAKLALRAVYASGQTPPALLSALSTAAGIGQPTQPLSPVEKQQLVRKIETQGDPHRGQWVYRRRELNCTGCHAITGAGGNIGPDLSGVGANSPTEYLLDSVLLPSQQIKEAYLTVNVLTVDGTLIRGVKVDEDPSRMVLRDADGREVTVPAADIEEEFPGKSLMPEGLHQLMTEQDLIDLVAFLAALGKPGDFAVNSRPTVQRFGLLVNDQTRQRLAAMGEGEIEGALGSVAEDQFAPEYALLDGRLPLSQTPAAQQQAPVILRAAIDVVVSGPVAVRVQPPRDVQVVIDGKSVVPNGQQGVSLPEGRHSLFLILEGTTRPDQLSVEVVPAPGSATQLTVVGGL